jgi:4a-hydroxytetrahydrobiopterin dehydratase
MAELLDDQAVTAGLEDLDGWRRDGDELVREFELTDFAAAIAFVGEVAEAAEAANHHPDILIHAYNKVQLSVTTHSAGGLTRNDLELAAAVDGIADDG